MLNTSNNHTSLFNLSSVKEVAQSLTSERCIYREFGIYADGEAFEKKFPKLAKFIIAHSADFLLSENFLFKKELCSALEQMPEYLVFLKTALRKDFFFAAFEQTEEQAGLKKTGVKDVRKFILERIQSKHETPRKNHEFIVEANGEIVGYAELFDQKIVDGKMQYERGVFILPHQQSNHYAKEAVIAITDYAFSELKAHHIFTMVDPNNIKSLNNIVMNSGAIKVGEEDSKYSHLEGGGEKRHLFHIYPEQFYDAVKAKDNKNYLIKKPSASI